MKRLLKNKYVLYYGLDFISLLLVWGGMLRKSFTSDTIFHMVEPNAEVQYTLEQGRYVRSLCDYLLLRLGVKTTTNLSIEMFLSFGVLALAMLMIQMVFAQWEPEEIWGKLGYNLILNLWVFNVLFAEVLMFSEMIIYFALAYLASAAAVWCYAQKKYLGMTLLLLVAACTYQYAVVYAAVWLVYDIWMQERRLSLKAVKRLIITIGASMGAGALNLLSILLFVKLGWLASFQKSAGVGDFGTKLAAAGQNFKELWCDALGIFPELWIPLWVMLAVAVLILFEAVKKKKLQEAAFLLLVSLGSFALLYVIPLVQQEFSFPPRMSCSFFAVQGLIMASAYLLLNTQRSRKLLTLGCVGYLLVHVLFADFIVTNHFVSNSLDKAYVRMAYEYITKYEQESGIEVRKLCMVNDIDAPARYREVSYVSNQINERSLGIVKISLMEVVTGRKFSEAEMDPDVYAAYFEGKNWDYFDPYEQIVIVGDTAYWCVF